MSSTNYSRLDNDEENSTKNQDDTTDIELGSVNAFTVIILNKEKTYQISGVTASTKLSQFKSWVAASTGVEIPQQRLIYTGRLLDNDDKMLSEYKITAACRVHLFPIPIANLVASTSSTSSTSPPVNATPFSNTNSGTPVYNPMFPNAFVDSETVNNAPLSFDDYVVQTSREVKLWSFILIFLSLMTIMDVFSALLTDSASLFGTRILHTVLVCFNSACSIAGLYVGQLGLNSARSLVLEDVTKYLKYLKFLAFAAISMRILWVFDVVQDVQKIVDDSQKPGSGGGSATGGDGESTNEIPLDQSVVQNYAIQAAIVCFVCAYAWGSCLQHAHRLHGLVVEYSDRHPPVASVTTTTAPSEPPAVTAVATAEIVVDSTVIDSSNRSNATTAPSISTATAV